MDYMHPDVQCPRKAIQLNHSLTTTPVTLDHVNSLALWDLNGILDK